MCTYFISDLHLSAEKAEISAAFLHFVKHTSNDAERVYILGDLFEFWIGEDAIQPLGITPIIEALTILGNKTDCYFIAGNRDFLINKKFTKLTNIKVLPDETVIDLYGTPTLILHGDSLCTDDIDHMKFRKKVTTNKIFHWLFLFRSIKYRLKQAEMARAKSAKHKSNISMEIMDVSENSVIESFKKHDVLNMIHGHTHRPNTHTYSINDKTATRTVLGDWYHQDSVLKVTEKGYEMSAKPYIN